MKIVANQIIHKDLSLHARDLTGLQFQGTRSRLRVQVGSPGHRCYGKVFNDLHSESLGYHVVPHRPYHSYIEGGGFRIETDEFGYPVYVAIAQWLKIAKEMPLAAPANFDLRDIRFLDLRIRCDAPEIRFDPDNALACLVFNDSTDLMNLALEPHAIWSIDRGGMLAALWLRDIVLDPSGKRFLKWRRRAWSRARRDFLDEPRAGRRLPLPLSVPEKLGSA